MSVEPAAKLDIDMLDVNTEIPCFNADRLCRALAKGGFSNSVETRWALDHFPCPQCWPLLKAMADDDSVDIHLEPLTRNAMHNYLEAPVALVLGRLVLHSRDRKTANPLPPTNRYLLQRLQQLQSPKKQDPRFNFWWLLVMESRLLALGSAKRHVERWEALHETLGKHPTGSPGDRELELLIQAYRGDELRMTWRPTAARKCLDQMLEDFGDCHPAIQAVAHEMRSDLARSMRDPQTALKHLAEAQKLLEGVEIPGRLAEIRTRIAMAQLLEGDLDAALKTFHEALDLIPEGTDPRLRLDALLHMAALTLRQEDFGATRHHLAEAEPLFAPHASDLMLAQRNWLWGMVHLNADDHEKAERSLRKALDGFIEFNALLDQAQVLVHLGHIYLHTKNKPRLDWVLTRLAASLRLPEVRFHILDEVESVAREARDKGLEVPDLRGLYGRKEPVH